MAQPFLGPDSAPYLPERWPGLRVARAPDHLLIDGPYRFRALSNAVHGGGLVPAERFINWKVPLDFDHPDPELPLRTALEAWGHPLDGTVALMTAADLSRCALIEADGEGFDLLCCTTAGVSNAVRAGAPRQAFPAYAPGTINTFLLLRGRFTDAALVNAALTAAEAKAAALHDLDVRDPDGDAPATGTSTDALVIAVCPPEEEPSPLHRYAGTATELGHRLGGAVYASLRECLSHSSPPLK